MAQFAELCRITIVAVAELFCRLGSGVPLPRPAVLLKAVPGGAGLLASTVTAKLSEAGMSYPGVDDKSTVEVTFGFGGSTRPTAENDGSKVVLGAPAMLK